VTPVTYYHQKNWRLYERQSKWDITPYPRSWWTCPKIL